MRPPQQKINLGTDGEATMTNKKNETLKAEASNATDVNMTLPKIGLDMDPKQFAELLKVGGGFYVYVLILVQHCGC